MLIYTDGSCLNNQSKTKSIGGWAGLIVFQDNEIEISDNSQYTTNNEMELLAVVECLKFVKNDNLISDNIKIYSDSLYVINAIQKGWLNNWKTNNFYIKNKEKRKNYKLWIQLDELHTYFENKNIEIVYQHVYGHSGNIMNDKVDKIARNRAYELKN